MTEMMHRLFLVPSPSHYVWSQPMCRRLGFVGKLDYLQQQFVDIGACVVGIQEARTDEIFSHSNQTYLRLASGADHGHFGVELWLALTIPFGHYKGRPRFFSKKDVTVLHRDPRRLLVRVCNDFLDVLLFVLHGPQSGRDQEERKDWWEHTTRVVQRFEHLGPLFVLGDMNATTGLADHVTVFRDDLVSPNTDFLRDFTTGQSLAFPATTMCHCGPGATWILMVVWSDALTISWFLPPSCPTVRIQRYLGTSILVRVTLII